MASSTARRLRRLRGAYLLRVVLSLADAPGNAVSYRIEVVDGRKPFRFLASKSGRATATAVVLLRVSPTLRTRVLRLAFDAGDPVGNEAQLAKTVRIR